MRINLITTELRTGGAERCLTELAVGLAARGDQVRVMSLAPLPHPPRDQLLNRLVEANLDVASAGASRPWSFVRAVAGVRRWIESDPPDVLQTFLYHANVLGTLAAAGAGVPVRVGGVRVAQPRPQRWWVERQAVKRMHGLVCVSRSVEQFARARLRPPATTRVVTIANGIRVEAFSGAAPRDWTACGLRSGSRVIMFVGRLHRQKGLDLLLAAAPDLLARHSDAALAIVGSGPLERQVRREIASLPEGRAVHLPWQPDVAGLYASAALVIVPSRYEGMPNVVLEAMAAGKPVAAADVEGVAELLGAAAAAQTFPRLDVATMSRRVDDLLGRTDLREIAAANRQRAEQLFSLDAMVDRYRQLYCELLERQRG